MKKNLLIFILAAGGALGFVGCYVDRPHEVVSGPPIGPSYSYEYYPDAEVYYQPQRQVYYWSEGGSWRSGPRAPQNIVLRTHVTVNLNSREPYRQHNEVRARYPQQRPQEQHDERHPDHGQS